MLAVASDNSPAGERELMHLTVSISFWSYPGSAFPVHTQQVHYNAPDIGHLILVPESIRIPFRVSGLPIHSLRRNETAGLLTHTGVADGSKRSGHNSPAN